jgi:GntR family transcriptional regulator/MocR family aminotransferase
LKLHLLKDADNYDVISTDMDERRKTEMLTIFLDKERSTPLFVQIYRSIREHIETGFLQSGEKIPSVRALAKELGIAPITVANAYSQLVAEGYLRTRPKSGFYVESVILGAVPVSLASPSHPSEEPDCPFDFRTNVVDPGGFPFLVWSRLEREALQTEEPDWINRVDPQGSLALRKEIASALARHRGFLVDPSRIIVGSGTEALLGLIVRLLEPSGSFGLENPGYPKVVRTLQGLHIPYVPLNLDEAGMRPEDARKAGVSIVHLTPSHQFPSGIVMPVGRRSEWLRWASEDPNRWIIEDDYDSEFRFSGMPIPAMRGMDASGRVLYLNSFSKSIAPSLRVGYLVLPADLAARFREGSPAYACSVPGFVQTALCAFLREGEFDRHLNRMKKIYRDKRDTLIAFLKQSRFGGSCQILHEDSGLHFLLQIQNGMDEITLVETAKKVGVRVQGISEYYLSAVGVRGFPTLIIGYSGMSSRDFSAAVSRLESVWAEREFPLPNGDTK